MKLLFKKIPVVFYLSLTLSLFLLYGNDSPVYDQDEAAYAGFAKTMFETGDYLTQSFPFSEPHRKPPLHFWLSAISFQTLGISEFSLRLLPSLWILLICLLTYDSAKRIYGDKTGLFGFLILATSLYFPLNGKIALVDSLLTFCETLGFYSLFRLLPKQHIQTYPWILLFWLSVALGTLTKGPPVLIFLGGICFVFLFFQETRKIVFLLKPWFFLPLSLLPLFYWGYLVWQKTNGELIRWMIDWYILRRAANPVFGQSGPPGTYLLLFFISLFPWSFYLPKALKEIWNRIKETYDHFRKKTNPPESINILLLGGLLFGWIFYECLMSKLPSYPLAVYPILAILMAKIVSESKMKWKAAILILAIAQSLAIVFIILPLLSDKRRDTIASANHWNRNFPIGTELLTIQNLALPSLAFYTNHPIRETELSQLQNLKKETILLLDSDNLLIVKTLGIRGESLGPEFSIWAYDRNKTIKLSLYKIW
ncbi:ArnT family glycosyltransferase [Leptospira ilyithenensis]|nr:glycosyltransferase family 39 protein [Leptospira ilyithenensis]